MGSEWKEVIFSEIIDINPNRRLNKGQECPYIDMQVVEPFTRKVSNITFKKYNGSGSRFKNGDTLFARITPCLENGKTAYVNELKSGEIGFGSTEFLVFSGKEGITDNLFVYYLSRFPEIREYAIKNMTGTSGRQRVDKSCFNELRIKLPPLPEQQKIASILSAFDDKIELNNEMNKTLEEIAQAIFNHWFIDFEFPNENGEPYKSSGGEFVDSELGPIPKGWKVSNIYENIERVSIKNKENKNYIVLTVSKEGKFVKSDEYFSKQVYSKKLTNYKIIKRNYIGYNPARANIGSIAMLTEYDVGLLSPAYEIFKLKENIMPYYFRYLMRREEFIKKIEHYSSGTTRQNFDIECFKFFGIVIPPMFVQKKFWYYIKDIELKMKQIEEENRTLSQLRDTLLPKLISGEIRVM